jgi:hypothetical protein
VKKALVQMVIMFCEAVRFKLILEEIIGMMKEFKTSVLPLLMWSWTNNWNTLSAFALNCKSREDIGVLTDDPVVVNTVTALGVNSRDDVVRVLGLIMRKASRS